MRAGAWLGAIDLTEAEKTVLGKIDFECDDHTTWHKTATAMEELTGMLRARNAIPEQRLRYVADSNYNVGGRGSSRYQVIERNDRSTPVLRNPAFLKHLHYFLFGPLLPPDVIQEFTRKVISCGEPFTGSDALVVADYARQLARAHALDRFKAPEEFFKLALDCGLDAHEARCVRDSVMKIWK